MSNSKSGLGGSSLLSSSKPQPNLGQSPLSASSNSGTVPLGSNPLAAMSSKPQPNLGQSPLSASSNSGTVPLGSNPLAAKSSEGNISLNPLAPSSTTSPSVSLQAGDLMPTQSKPQTLSFTEATQGVSEGKSRGLYLSSVGHNKVKVVKAIRAHWGTGLKEAKHLADSAPTNLPALPESKMMVAEKELKALGAVCNLT